MNKVKFPKLSTTSTSSIDKKNINNVFRDKNQEDIVKKAIEVGFLVYPSKEYILKEYDKQKDKKDGDEFSVKSLQKNSLKELRKTKLDIYIDNCLIDDKINEIKYLNFSNVPIAELGDISLCQNLVILNLSNNYLINIEPLSECIHLLRIDLQNNQVN
jgi:Leucine-rich repeat (LRR) protein